MIKQWFLTLVIMLNCFSIFYTYQMIFKLIQRQHWYIEKNIEQICQTFLRLGIKHDSNHVNLISGYASSSTLIHECTHSLAPIMCRRKNINKL